MTEETVRAIVQHACDYFSDEPITDNTTFEDALLDIYSEEICDAICLEIDCNDKLQATDITYETTINSLVAKIMSII